VGKEEIVDHVNILERAVHVATRYRALWVLGFLWCFVGGCSGSPASFANSFQYRLDSGSPWPRELELQGLTWPHLEPATWLGIGLALLAAVIMLAIVCTVIKYVVQAGVYRSLDQLDRQVVVPTVRGAWREGWHRRTWRLWFQNLVVDIPLFIAVMLTFLLAISPLVLLFAHEGGVKLLGLLSATALVAVWIVCAIVVGAAIGVLKELWWRAAVTDDYGFLEAIRQGWQLACRNAGDAVKMWLLMVLAGIIWGVFSIFLVILLLILTGGVAGVPAYLLWQAGHQLGALVYGLAVATITFALPICLAGGLYLIFRASVWSQVYRQFADRRAAMAR
jgi:hypothetical protein